MENQLIITICLFAGSLLYFIVKGKKMKKDSQAANLEFSWANYFGEQSFDILIALGICAALRFGGGAVDGIPANFSGWMASLTTGVGVSHMGVNVVLGIFGLGDVTRKRVRKVVDKKTNIADGK